MIDTYLVYIGPAEKDDPGVLRGAYSKIAIKDQEGTDMDKWFNYDSPCEIGDGSGTWTFMRSQGHLLLWGTALEFVARFKDFSPNSGRVGTVELARPLCGLRTLSYQVRPL